MKYPKDGKFGEFGGKYIPETLVPAIEELEENYLKFKDNKDFKKEDFELTSYEVAHHIGLLLEEEYELLNLLDERQRQEYLKRHLTKSIPMVAGMEKLKEKIKLNGHFKNLGGVDFEK